MRKIVIAMAPAFAALGLLLGTVAASQSPVSAPMGTATAEPVMYGTENDAWAFNWYHGEVRPGGIYFGAGGDRNITKIQWLQWNALRAYGLGALYQRTCWGNCFKGTNTTVGIALGRVRTHHGHRYYSRMTVFSNHHTHKVVYSYGTCGAGTSHEAFWRPPGPGCGGVPTRPRPGASQAATPVRAQVKAQAGGFLGIAPPRSAQPERLRALARSCQASTASGGEPCM